MFANISPVQGFEDIVACSQFLFFCQLHDWYFYEENLTVNYSKELCSFTEVIEQVSSRPFGVDPQVMMSIIKGLYSLKPGLYTVLLKSVSYGWLVSTLDSDQVVQLWTLAGTRHLTLTVPLSTKVYTWILTNLMLGLTL